MTPAEALLHDIANSFASLPARVEVIRERCPYCGGSGHALDGKRCWACAGNGTVTREVAP